MAYGWDKAEILALPFSSLPMLLSLSEPAKGDALKMFIRIAAEPV